MKLKPFVRVRRRAWGIKVTAGMTLVDEEPRADMFLPAWLFGMSLLLLAFGGILMAVFIATQPSVFLFIAAAALLLLGVAAMMCWKNQTIRMLDDDRFEYSTFLGKKIIYRYSDIKELKKNTDSMTLLVADGTVHIESVAVITDRLAKRVNQELTDSQWLLWSEEDEQSCDV